MKFSRSTTLSPVIISAIFTLLLSACSSSSNGTNDGTQMPADQSSSEMMQQSESSVPTDTGSSSMPSSSEAAMQQSESAVVPKQKYQDGTFSAVGTYQSPAGMEEVNVSLTLKNGIVSSATMQGSATNPKSMKFQSLFSQGFQQEVVGKSIDSLSLDVVNGSSLTPMGFMDALAKIKVEAAA